MQPLQTSVICLLVHRAFIIVQNTQCSRINRLKNDGHPKFFRRNRVGQLPMDQTWRGHWTLG